MRCKQKRCFRAAVFAVLVSYAYVFMEWLFFATKPSFLSSAGVFDLVLAFFVPALLAAFIGAGAVLLLAALSGLMKGLLPRNLRAFLMNAVASLYLLIPAVLLGAALFLWIDNFTYTLFKKGVVSSTGGWRVFYAFLFIGLCTIAYRVLSSVEKAATSRRFLCFSVLSLVLLCLSLAVGSAGYFNRRVNALFIGKPNNSKPSGGTFGYKAALREFPNIIMFGTDGLNASRTSLYGYHRDTTPFLREWSRKSIVFENNFTNCANTGCSLSSTLTGKSPAETKLIYPPDILKGTNSFQHLPGILKRYGYSTMHLSVRHYADMYDLNMRYGFDSSNGRSIGDVRARFLPASLSMRFGEEEYFLGQMYYRITDRIFHSFGIKTMSDPFREATNATIVNITDRDRLKNLFDFIEDAKGPFFAHVHLMGTHGPIYHSAVRMFSKGKVQAFPRMLDFEDDAILDYDYLISQLVQYLKQKGLIDKTVLVFGTDHGRLFDVNKRIPLVIYLPDGIRKGRIAVNTQNMDIAPSLLDYIGIDIPEWMDGASFFSDDIDRFRPIISIASNAKLHKRRKKDGRFIRSGAFAPIEAIGMVQMVVCSRYFQISFENNKCMSGEIEGHTSPCTENSLPSDSEMKSYILSYLKRHGYDLSKVNVPDC